MALSRTAFALRPRDVGACAALLLAFSACGGKESSADSTRADTAAVVAAQEPDTNRHAFWTRFRDAVLQSDTAALLKLTSRPFSTRGSLDGMPWITRDSAATVAVLDSLLQADPGLTPTPSTMRELVRSTSVLDAAAQAAPDEFRVGEFVFMRVEGRWRFAKAYLPD